MYFEYPARGLSWVKLGFVSALYELNKYGSKDSQRFIGHSKDGASLCDFRYGFPSRSL